METMEQLLEKATLKRGHLYTTNDGRQLILQDPDSLQPESVVKMTEEDQKKMVGYMKSNQNDVSAAYIAFMKTFAPENTKLVSKMTQTEMIKRIKDILNASGIPHPHYDAKTKTVFWKHGTKQEKTKSEDANGNLVVKRAIPQKQIKLKAITKMIADKNCYLSFEKMVKRATKKR